MIPKDKTPFEQLKEKESHSAGGVHQTVRITEQENTYTVENSPETKIIKKTQMDQTLINGKADAEYVDEGTQNCPESLARTRGTKKK